MAPLVRFLAVLSVALGVLVLPVPAPAQAAPAQPTAGQSTYVPRTPVRLLDTRDTRTPFGPGETRALRVAGVQGVPASATAVVLSVTAIGPSEATSLEVTPTTASAGTTSVLVRARSSASNLVTVAVGPDGTVSLRNARGTVGSSSTCPATTPGAPGRRSSPSRRAACSTPATPARRSAPARCAPCGSPEPARASRLTPPRSP